MPLTSPLGGLVTARTSYPRSSGTVFRPSLRNQEEGVSRFLRESLPGTSSGRLSQLVLDPDPIDAINLQRLTQQSFVNYTSGAVGSPDVLPAPASHSLSESGQELDAFAVLDDLIGSIEGPSDWADEHDHYLYGTPKRASRRE